MNYAIGIVGGVALGGASYFIAKKIGYFSGVGFTRYIYSGVSISAGASLGFTAVAISRTSLVGITLGINILTIQGCILSIPAMKK